MADTVKCPVCNENNPKEFEFCQYCQSRLQPLTGPLKGADAPIKPGSAPTKKSTADLEPILPKWLRDARSSARDASEGDLPQTTQPKTSPRFSSEPQDLLAGLRSQAEEDDDETPDWLANITGGAPSSKNSKEEPSDVRWVELGGAKDSAPESDVPSWMQGLTPIESQPDKQDGLTDWMHEASGAPQQPAADSQDWLRQMSDDDSGKLFDDSQKTFDAAPEAPSWLNSLGSQSNAESTPAEAPDWLNSLGSQGNTESNVTESPDWLNSLGAQSNPVSESPDWLRSLDAADSSSKNNDALFSSAAPAASDTPDWLSSLGAQDNIAPAQPADASDWLRSLDAADSSSQNNEPLFGSAAPAASDTPDWLSSLGAQDNAAPAQSADASDWLRSLDSADTSSQNQNNEPLFGSSAPAQADTPDWLSSLGAQDNAAPAQSADTSDWLRSLDSADTSSQNQNNEPLFGSSAPAESDTPDWMRGLDASPTQAPISAGEDDWLKGMQSGGNLSAQSDPLAEGDMPSWLSDSAIASAASLPETNTDDAALGDVPSWLKAAAPQSSIYDDLPAAQQPVESSENPDWLNTFKSLDPAPVVQVESTSAFASDGNTDTLFTDMPDWLAGSVESDAPLAAAEIPAESDIEASQLPSWVQAMRPVDTGTAQISISGDQTLEARGALSGLQGVLPAVPGYAPTSKPKAYSLKLQATDEQLSQAALLEQILAAETSPVPIASFSTLRTSRGLRGSLAFIFFTMVFAVLFLRTQIFSLPVGIPSEVDGVVQVVGAVREGAPILVAFDYEPARVGEMEVVAAPVFDQLVLLRHPRLTFIATNENSSILADRFMITGPMADHHKNGLQYLNLGYLPGGQMGIRAFAQNPHETARFDITFAPAWDSIQLQDVKSFSQFAAFILVTDSADSARAWIEQTTSARGAMPTVVISSAQSAPMIQPYYASGQIQGLVSGLQGGAIFEQSNAGRPGTARIYWDAYSIGMLIAMVLILGGGLWNLFLGSRDRAAAREMK